MQKNNLAARAGRWSAHHRKRAILGWIAFVILATVLGGAVGQRMLADEDTGNGESRAADQAIAAAGVLVGQPPLPDGAPEHGREDDERDPAEDRALAVMGAPAARAGGEVVLRHVHHRASGARALLRGEPPSHRFGCPQPRRAALPPRVGVILPCF